MLFTKPLTVPSQICSTADSAAADTPHTVRQPQSNRLVDEATSVPGGGQEGPEHKPREERYKA